MKPQWRTILRGLAAGPCLSLAGALLPGTAAAAPLGLFSQTAQPGGFTRLAPGPPPTILVDPREATVVGHAAGDLASDIASVTGQKPELRSAAARGSHGPAVILGTLGHSRAFIVRAYLLQTHEMLFDALTQAFRVLGGVPQRGIFDNMKTAVDRIGSGKTRQINARFAAMASHYLFEPEFCNPASGWEKGQVEKNVQDARRRLWQPMPSFADLAELNAWLEERCIAQWGQEYISQFQDPPKRWKKGWNENSQ